MPSQSIEHFGVNSFLDLSQPFEQTCFLIMILEWELFLSQLKLRKSLKWSFNLYKYKAQRLNTFFEVLASHLPELDGFDQHLQALSSNQRCLLHYSNINFPLKILRGHWESNLGLLGAKHLPMCYAVSCFVCLFVCLFVIHGKTAGQIVSKLRGNVGTWWD